MLSELGRTQGRLLGEYFLSQKLTFDTVIAGSLNRQRQTAEAVAQAYYAANVSFPAMTIDADWDEFDLTRVYREIAPQLCADDAEFAREYQAMKEQILASARLGHGNHPPPVAPMRLKGCPSMDERPVPAKR